MIKNDYRVHAGRIVNEILKSAEEGKEFFFFVHTSVDGDCIGSSCGTAQVLRNMGYKARVILCEELPYTMEFMNLGDLVVQYDEVKGTGAKEYIAFATDVSEAHRMGDCGKLFEKADDPLVIDHHISVDLSGDRVWIDGECSSASEMCYYAAQVIEERAGRKLIDAKAALCFLTGIVTDTGRFTYTNTMPETLICAGELMEMGGTISDICYNLFDRHTKENFALITYLRSKVELHNDGKISMVRVVRPDFEHFGADDTAIDVLPSALRNIEGVELSVVLREKKDVIRCNLRSKDYFDCSSFAQSFGGGGHKRASGFSLPRETNNIDDVAVEVIKRASELLK